MATKKQLAALARGRAIRLAKIKNKKSTKKTKAKYHRKTKLNWDSVWNTVSDFSKKSKAVADVAGNIISPLGVFASGIENAKRLYKAICSLFEDDKNLDSAQLKAVVANMRKQLEAKDPALKQSELYKKCGEIIKNLVYIEMLTNSGQEAEAKTEIRNVLFMFSRVLDEFNTEMAT